MAGSQDGEYEVYRILDKRIAEDNSVDYLIRWKGFNEDWDSWEPLANLTSCLPKIYAYEKKIRIKQSKNARIFIQKLVKKSKMNGQRKRTLLGKKSKQEVGETIGKPTGSGIDRKRKGATESGTVVKKRKYVKKKPKLVENNSSSTNDTASTLVASEKLQTPETVVKKKRKYVRKTPKLLETNSSSTNDKQSTLVYSGKSMTPKTVVKKRKYVRKTPKLLETNLSSTNDKQNTLVYSGKSMTPETVVKKRKYVRKTPKPVEFNQSPGSDKTNSLLSPETVVTKETENKSKKDLKTKNSSVSNTKSELKVVHDKMGSSKNDSTGGAHKGLVKKRRKLRKIQNNKPVVRSGNKLRLSVSHLVQLKGKEGNGLKRNKGITTKRELKSGLIKPNITKDKKGSVVSDSESDDGVLYSLSDADLSLATVASQDEASQTKSDRTIFNGKKTKKKVGFSERGKDKLQKEKEHKPRMKKMKLISSLKSGVKKQAIPIRPVSPTPLYMRLDPGATTATLLPSSSPMVRQPQWVIMDEEHSPTPITDQQASLPMSPASMSYKMLLDNLPNQLHPKKNKRTEETDEEVERRLSVRASECAFKYKEIVIKKCHKYTQIWLNTHTKMKNALNPVVMQEICSALNAAKYDDSNLVVFSGLGNVFCSGVDLQYLTQGDRKVAARKMVDALRDLVRKFIMFPKQIVAVVTGPAIGLGCSLLPLCDIVYASDKATFYMPYAQLAQTPEGCATYTFQHSLGNAMANEMLIGGRKITAIEACQLGLISQVFWPTSMMQEVIPRVQHMALLNSKVLETTKLLIRSHQRTKLDLTNESECNLLVERWPSTDCQKCLTEFLCNEKNYNL